jgi:hypothetical protein
LLGYCIFDPTSYLEVFNNFSNIAQALQLLHSNNLLNRCTSPSYIIAYSESFSSMYRFLAVIGWREPDSKCRIIKPFERFNGKPSSFQPCRQSSSSVISVFCPSSRPAQTSISLCIKPRFMCSSTSLGCAK